MAPTEAAATDDLACRYTCAADDSTLSKPQREAMMLFAVAEGHLSEEEDFEEALKSAQDALKLFKEAGDKKGEADTLRLIVTANRAKAQALRYLEGEAATAGALEDAKKYAAEMYAAFKAAGEKRGAACMLFSLAECKLDLKEEALEELEEAKATFKELGDGAMEANAALGLAACMIQQEKAKEAVEAATAALEINRSMGAKKGEARAQHALSVALSRGPLSKDAYAKGVQAAKEALAIVKELGHKKLEAYELFTIAQWNLLMDNPKGAVTPAKEAAALFKELGYGKGWQPHSQGAYIFALAGSGQAKQAVKIANDAVIDFQAAGDKRCQVLAMENLIHAHLEAYAQQECDLREAESASDEGLALCVELGEKQWEANMLHNQAQVTVRTKELSKAEKSVDSSVEILAGLGAKSEQATAMHTQLDVYLERGDTDKAMEVANKIRVIYQEIGNKKKEASASLLLATCYFNQGNFQGAIEVATEAQTVFMEVGDKKGEGMAWGLIHEVRAASGEQDEALKASRTQSALLSQAGDKKSQADSLKAGAQLFGTQGRPDEAVKASNEALAMARAAGDLRTEVEMLNLVASSNLAAMMQAAERVAEKAKANLLSKGVDRALRPAREAVALSKKLGDKQLQAIALFTVSQVHTVTGQFEAGIATAKSCKEIFEELADMEGVAHALCVSAEAHFLKGNRGKADEEASQAYGMFHELQDGAGEAKVGAMIQKFREQQVVSFTASAGGATDADAASAGGEVVSAKPTMDYAMAAAMAKDVAVQAIGDSDEVDMDSPLMDIGLDSLAAIGFRESLIAASGLQVPTSLVFDYPSLTAIADLLVETSKG
jgi:tetratricopeptide (TPR) repeat protein